MSTKKKVKIAFVGSREFNNVDLMKSVMKGAVSKFGKGNVTIISGGQSDGADGIAKTLAIETEHLSYVEFPPKHYKWNEYCFFDKSRYDESFNVSHYHERNDEIAKRCDMLIAFLPEHKQLEDSSGTASVVKKAKKYNKPVHILK